MHNIKSPPSPVAAPCVSAAVTCRPRARTLALALLLLAPALAGAQQSLAPSGWDAALTLAQPADQNPDPNILEIDLKARLADVTIGGTTVKAWTYDGLLPGPLIRAKVGDRLI